MTVVFLHSDGILELHGDGTAVNLTSRPTCSYVPQRGTEQECSPELWRVEKRKLPAGLAPGGLESFRACTLHLPHLLTDQFVLEYSLTRLRQ